MPELPEVESIKRGLLKNIVGKHVVKITTIEKKSFFGKKGDIEGKKIAGLRRRGKALLMDFEDGASAMVHLRMTGQLVYEGKTRFGGGHPTEDMVGELPSKHTRVIMEFNDGSKLFFNDQRKFGFIKVIREPDAFLKKLGPEPWDKSLDKSGFFERLQRHRGMMVKGALLDQSIIAGVGNIYADEALFYAKVHPARRVSSLTEREVEKILEGIRKIMDKSIEAGGSSIKNYVKADGTKGDYLEKFAQVFGREGERCPRCGTKIVKIRVVGRGTHICPKCQKAQDD